MSTVLTNASLSWQTTEKYTQDDNPGSSIYSTQFQEYLMLKLYFILLYCYISIYSNMGNHEFCKCLDLVLYAYHLTDVSDSLIIPVLSHHLKKHQYWPVKKSIACVLTKDFTLNWQARENEVGFLSICRLESCNKCFLAQVRFSSQTCVKGFLYLGSSHAHNFIRWMLAGFTV